MSLYTGELFIANFLLEETDFSITQYVFQTFKVKKWAADD